MNTISTGVIFWRKMCRCTYRVDQIRGKLLGIFNFSYSAYVRFREKYLPKIEVFVLIKLTKCTTADCSRIQKSQFECIQLQIVEKLTQKNLVF